MLYANKPPSEKDNSNINSASAMTKENLNEKTWKHEKEFEAEMPNQMREYDEAKNVLVRR